jgi:hypothetical protein
MGMQESRAASAAVSSVGAAVAHCNAAVSPAAQPYASVLSFLHQPPLAYAQGSDDKLSKKLRSYADEMARRGACPGGGGAGVQAGAAGDVARKNDH